jgi:hypothetical protein
MQGIRKIPKSERFRSFYVTVVLKHFWRSYAGLCQIEEKQSRMAPGGSIQEEREHRKYGGASKNGSQGVISGHYVKKKAVTKRKHACETSHNKWRSKGQKNQRNLY